MSENIQRLPGHGRAWVEIDLDALAHNVAELRSMLPVGCELMAIIKADAYGHGAQRVSARLQCEGIEAFGVATVDEGVILRESGLKGEILVLGYTHPDNAHLLSNFDLSQIVVDAAYANALNRTGYMINVHIAIDTGMHRLGIFSSDFDEIESIYSYKNLTVKGVASHLSSSDSLDESDLKFSHMQIERFSAIVGKLKHKGYNVGKLHIQASDGLFNYPEIKYDYVRVGIALFGVMSHDYDVNMKPVLRPMLSIRAFVAQVRWIGAGESVSYGRIFTSDKPTKIATVCIGYADGIPRQMSGNGGVCIVRGHKVPIVGRICMDMLMLDVTEVDSVIAGDIATFIGSDASEEIRCEYVAAASGTITNDILCRLGSRLPRIYI